MEILLCDQLVIGQGVVTRINHRQHLERFFVRRLPRF
jgi:hypothetical protein